MTGMVAIGKEAPTVIAWRRSKSHDALMERIFRLEIDTEMGVEWSSDWLAKQKPIKKIAQTPGYSMLNDVFYQCYICGKHKKVADGQINTNFDHKLKTICPDCAPKELVRSPYNPYTVNGRN